MSDNRPKMKYGVFGGTFDPFTIAHYAIVKEILKRKLVDKVIILPSIVDYYRKDKSKRMGCSDKILLFTRVMNKEATTLTFSRNQDVSMFDPESYSTDIIVDFFEHMSYLMDSNSYEGYVENRRYVNTLSDVINRYGVDNEYFTIIGTDSYVNLPMWSRYKAITGMGKLIVVDGRNGSSLPDYVKTDPDVYAVVEIDKKFSDVSASKIREEYHGRKVEEYISDLKRQVDEYNGKKSFHTPIFDVFERENEGYGFKPVAVQAPDWVAVCAERDGKYILTKQLRYGTMTEVEEFPCGCVEKGESADVAAARELAEETGYNIDPKNLTYLGKVATNPGFMTNFMHYFYVNLNEIPYTIKNPQLDEHEKLTAYLKDINKFKEDFYSSEVRPVFVAGMLNLMEHQGVNSMPS